MKLTPAARKQLGDALLAAFTLAELQRMVATRLGGDLQRLALGGDLQEIVFKLIDQAERGNWTPQLVTGALSENSGSAELNTFVTQFPEYKIVLTPGPPVNHFDVCVLRGKQPFVNRHQLRTALRQLNDDRDGNRVLVVTGPPTSGKTYSRELIWYLEEATKRFEVAWIDLVEDATDPDFGPGDLVRSLVLQMRRPVTSMPVQQAQAARWVRELRDWLIAEISQTGSQWWIVIDGFNHSRLNVETLDLIQHVARRIALLPSASNCRLVLLGYADSLPPDLAGRFLREQTEPLGESHLKEYFTHVFKDHGAEEVDSTVLDEVVRQVLTAVNAVAPAPGQTTSIARVIREAVEELFPE
jgi:effector-associated domain 1 (EAD1)-containing protein